MWLCVIAEEANLGVTETVVDLAKDHIRQIGRNTTISDSSPISSMVENGWVLPRTRT